jgi:hypothetical protein
MNEINPNHARSLEIYGYFLKDIANDEGNGMRVLEKSQKLVKSLMRGSDFEGPSDETQETCILTVSGNQKNMGVVKNANNQVY